MLNGRSPRYSILLVELTNDKELPEVPHMLKDALTRYGAERAADQMQRLALSYWFMGWWGFQVVITELETGSVVQEFGKVFD